jgi:hypothetical protein
VQEKIAKLEGPLHGTLQAESQIRGQMTASAPYQVIEQTAILAGEPSLGSSASAPRGIWVQQPHGYYVRYLPDGCDGTQLYSRHDSGGFCSYEYICSLSHLTRLFGDAAKDCGAPITSRIGEP